MASDGKTGAAPGTIQITAELSLYPLQGDPIPAIKAFIGELQAGGQLEVVVNPLSTQLRGDLNTVMAAVHEALRLSFRASDTRVLVAKFLNVDLPIGEPVSLDD